MASQQAFRRIGAGCCGSVWASDDSHAMKREDGGPGRSLLNDYNMHQKIMQTLLESQTATIQPRISLPICHQFVGSGDQEWWNSKFSRFPNEVQMPCNTLVSDRIPPFPQEVRDTIIDMYCPESLKLLIKSSAPDQDCLIRPYLGRRRRTIRQSRFQGFSLRNYPLHVDQMEELALDMMTYAEIMAETLAHLYWRAHVDANDVEFVLAPPSPPHSGTFNSDILGEHSIWLLDFDCCRHMTFDEEGVKQAVEAFYRNDPFFPRSGRADIRDQNLWSGFKRRFLQAAEEILRSQGTKAHLPVLWINMVEERGRRSIGQ